MTELAEKTIGVIGLGQIGGSLCAAMSSWSGTTILGYDITESLGREAADRTIVSEIVSSCQDLIDRADIVLIATPQNAALDILAEHAARLRPKLLVSDTGSLKELICAAAARLKLTNFVGGHPLAGTEKKAPDAWQADLFAGAPYFCCSAYFTNRNAFDALETMARQLGSRFAKVDPTEHDRLFALTSGLPHAIALALRSMAGGGTELFEGPSFRSATRVAQSEETLVKHLLLDNRDHVASHLTELIDRLSRLKKDLESGSDRVLHEFLAAVTKE